MPTKRWESFAMAKSYFWLLYVYPCFWRFLSSLVMPLLELSCVYLIKLYLQCARHSEGNDLNSQHTFSSLICNSQLTAYAQWHMRLMWKKTSLGSALTRLWFLYIPVVLKSLWDFAPSLLLLFTLKIEFNLAGQID